jgi:hypothetical protein
MFGFFCSLVSSLSRWFLWRRLLLLLLLLLNLPLQVSRYGPAELRLALGTGSPDCRGKLLPAVN